MRTLFIIFIFFIVGCAHKLDTKGSLVQKNKLTISDRLLAVCNSVHDFGVSDPQKLADLLDGKIISDSEIRGPGFKSATLWKNKDFEQVEVYFSVDEELQLTLADLRTQFKTSKTINEGKTSAVHFDNVSGPCGELYVSANLFFSKVNDKSPVLSFKMRKTILGSK